MVGKSRRGGVLFAGDLLFIGCTPIVWEGPIANWITACDTMLGLNAPTVVPGHGPITDADGIHAVRGYLNHGHRTGRRRPRQARPFGGQP